jgi:hypothetical protein
MELSWADRGPVGIQRREAPDVGAIAVMPGTWSRTMRWTFRPELITDVIGDRAGRLEETKSGPWE